MISFLIPKSHEKTNLSHQRVLNIKNDFLHCHCFSTSTDNGVIFCFCKARYTAAKNVHVINLQVQTVSCACCVCLLEWCLPKSKYPTVTGNYLDFSKLKISIFELFLLNISVVSRRLDAEYHFMPCLFTVISWWQVKYKRTTSLFALKSWREIGTSIWQTFPRNAKNIIEINGKNSAAVFSGLHTKCLIPALCCSGPATLISIYLTRTERDNSLQLCSKRRNLGFQ